MCIRDSMIGKRVTVAGAIPAVARDLVSFPNTTGREYDGFGSENPKTTTLAIVTEGFADSRSILQQCENTHLHVHIDSAMNPVILQGADHFQAGEIADVREARIFMAAKIPLQTPTVLCSIENRAPSLKFAHTRGRLPSVQLRHSPIVDVLTSAHRVGEVHFPTIAVVDVTECSGDSAFGHHGVRLAKQAL